MPERSIPVALVGFGGSGSGIHAPLIDATEGLDVAVVVARGEERRAAAAQRYPHAEVTDSLDAAKAAAVAVVTLPVHHRGDTVAHLVDAGTRVVVEKPFAGDLAGAQQLAARVGDQVTVFHNRRWDSDFLTLKRLNKARAWTGPVRLTSRIQRWQPTVRDSWRNDPEGGGFLREVGPHQIDQAIQLLGPVTGVYAEVLVRRPGSRTEDDVFLALTHADGSVSHLISGALGNTDLPRFEVSALDALVSLGTADPQHDQLHAGLSPLDPSWGITDASDWRRRGADGEWGDVVPERGWWPGFYQATRDWLSGSGGPVSVEDGVATMQVIDAARESARSGRREPIGAAR
ncbi:MAG: Gfo/Idh/MocA family protein [Microbacterium sp.]|uniref:Gfo/Idh/MocA family protein n=1 Tax=Microbacterium sp. TaxID=51671 RepID=UPI003F7F8145